MNAGDDWTPHWREQLRSGLAAMALVLDHAQQEKLLDYLRLLRKWNRAFNLTAVRTPGEMVPRHLLDSLSILGLVEGPSVLDVGSGPGLPGIPLAVARPDLAFTLLDGNGKKTRFLRQAKMELALRNVDVVRARVESFQPPGRFHTVTSRAFSSLLQFSALCSRLVADEGCLLAMKGGVANQEISALHSRCSAVEVVALRVPETTGQRHAVIMRPRSRG